MGFADSLRSMQIFKRFASSDTAKVLADKEKRKELIGKAQGVVSSNQDQIHGVIEKAGSAVSEKTGGKYDSHITKVSTVAAKVVNKAAGSDGATTVTDPPAQAPAAAEGEAEASQASS